MRRCQELPAISIPVAFMFCARQLRRLWAMWSLTRSPGASPSYKNYRLLTADSSLFSYGYWELTWIYFSENRMKASTCRLLATVIIHLPYHIHIIVFSSIIVPGSNSFAHVTFHLMFHCLFPHFISSCRTNGNISCQEWVLPSLGYVHRLQSVREHHCATRRRLMPSKLVF